MVRHKDGGEVEKPNGVESSKKNKVEEVVVDHPFQKPDPVEVKEAAASQELKGDITTMMAQRQKHPHVIEKELPKKVREAMDPEVMQEMEGCHCEARRSHKDGDQSGRRQATVEVGLLGYDADGDNIDYEMGNEVDLHPLPEPPDLGAVVTIAMAMEHETVDGLWVSTIPVGPQPSLNPAPRMAAIESSAGETLVSRLPRPQHLPTATRTPLYHRNQHHQT